MKILLTILFLITCATSFGQRNNLIIGVVKSFETEKPLENVKIFWSDDTDVSVTTDRFGVFKITNRQTDSTELVFQLTGKEEKRIKLSSNDNLERNVLMEKEAPTSITASRWKQSVDEIPASIIIIDRAEIEAQGYITVQEILENVPGMFAIDQRSNSGISLGIRGFWSKTNQNVMIQVNGVSMLTDAYNKFDLHTINIPVEAIDKIEVVRGPMAVNYGFGAFYGVVNIVTNGTEKASPSGAFAGGLGSQNSNKLFARYTVRKNDLNLSLNLSHFKREGFNEKWSDFVSDSAYAADPSIQSLLNNNHDQIINSDRFSKHRYGVNLHLNYKGVFGNFNYGRSDIGYSVGTIGSIDRNTLISNSAVGQIGYRSNYKRKQGNRFQQEYKLDINKSSDVGIMSYNQEDTLSYQDVRSSSLKSEINMRLMLIHTNKKAVEAGEDDVHLELMFGSFTHTNFQNQSVFTSSKFSIARSYWGLKPNTNVTNGALYVTTALKYNKLNVEFGLRGIKRFDFELLNSRNDIFNSPGYDSLILLDPNYKKVYIEEKITSNGFKLIPRIGINYDFHRDSTHNHHYVKFLFGQALNRSTIIDNSSLMSNVAWDTIPSSGLVPQLISSLEFGYTYFNDSTKFRISNNFFTNHINKLLTHPTYSEDSTFIFEEGYHTIGFELTVDRSWIIKDNTKYETALSGRIGGSFQRTSPDSSPSIAKNKYVDLTGFGEIFDGASYKENNTPLSPRFMANANFTARIRKVSVGIGANYVGRMKALDRTEFINANGIKVIRYQAGEELPGFFRFSLNLRLENLELLGVKFDEKFGEKVEERLDDNFDGLYINLRISNVFGNKYFYPTGAVNTWADEGILGRGRQFLFTLGYKF